MVKRERQVTLPKYKANCLDGILSVLTRVVQEQQREIESLKAQMALASGV